jgi:hypothetical protein
VGGSGRSVELFLLALVASSWKFGFQRVVCVSSENFNIFFEENETKG